MAGGFTTFINQHPQTRTRGLLMLALTNVAVIEEVSYTSDGGGGTNETWNAIGTTVCRLDPAGFGTGRTVGDRLDEAGADVVTMPLTAVVNFENRLLIDGGTFAITGAQVRDDRRLQRLEVIQL